MPNGITFTTDERILLLLYASIADRNGTLKFDFPTIHSRTGLPASVIVSANQKFKESGLLRLLSHRRGWLKLDFKRLQELGINPTPQTVGEAA